VALTLSEVTLRWQAIQQQGLEGRCLAKLKQELAEQLVMLQMKP
jgi:hypothetical protein